MVSVVAPPPIVAVAPGLAELQQIEEGNLAHVAERLRQEVAAASTRNALTAKNTIEQVREVATFEKRARSTLRSLVEKMSEDHGRSD